MMSSSDKTHTPSSVGRGEWSKPETGAAWAANADVFKDMTELNPGVAVLDLRLVKAVRDRGGQAAALATRPARAGKGSGLQRLYYGAQVAIITSSAGTEAADVQRPCLATTSSAHPNDEATSIAVSYQIAPSVPLRRPT